MASFESFVEVQLQDAELNAVDADLLQRLSAACALTAHMAELGAAGAFDELTPGERAEAIAVLDEQIAQLETLRG